MTWREALGKQIRQARETAGLSQQQLGAAVEKSRTMVGRYEAGTDAPSLDVLSRIALKLGMTHIEVNGYRILVTHGVAPPAAQATQQLKFDFGKEYTYSGATLRLRPNELTITITVTALEPASVSSQTGA